MNYLELLEYSYKKHNEWDTDPLTRLEYLSEYIFDFTTYDTEISELLANRALEVCAAISGRTTFDYIKFPENYENYILMCNLPFFASRIEWGGSIRGAWWGSHPLDCLALWDGDKQLLRLEFKDEEWLAFVAALIEFGAAERGTKIKEPA